MRALCKLNPKLAATPEGRAAASTLARDQLLDADPTKTLLQHNEAKWRLMRDGITLKSPGGNAAEDVHVTVIDFQNPVRMTFWLCGSCGCKVAHFGGAVICWASSMVCPWCSSNSSATTRA